MPCNLGLESWHQLAENKQEEERCDISIQISEL